MAGLIGAVIEARPLGATSPLVLVGGVLAVLCGGGVRDGRATLAFTDGATGEVVIVANLLSGWLIGHAGSRTPMVIGAIVGAARYALLLRLGAASSYPGMRLAFVQIPAGMGLAVPAMTTATLAAVDRKWAGTVSALLRLYICSVADRGRDALMVWGERRRDAPVGKKCVASESLRDGWHDYLFYRAPPILMPRHGTHTLRIH